MHMQDSCRVAENTGELRHGSDVLMNINVMLRRLTQRPAFPLTVMARLAATTARSSGAHTLEWR
jgi:hypothetical protein